MTAGQGLSVLQAARDLHDAEAAALGHGAGGLEAAVVQLQPGRIAGAVLDGQLEDVAQVVEGLVCLVGQAAEAVLSVQRGLTGFQLEGVQGHTGAEVVAVHGLNRLRQPHVREGGQQLLAVRIMQRLATPRGSSTPKPLPLGHVASLHARAP